MRRAMRPGRSIFSANYDVLRLFGSPLAKVAFIYLYYTLQHGGELAAARQLPCGIGQTSVEQDEQSCRGLSFMPYNQLAW